MVPKGTSQAEKSTTKGEFGKPSGSVMEDAGINVQQQPDKTSGESTPLTKTQRRNRRKRMRDKEEKQQMKADSFNEADSGRGEKRLHSTLSTPSPGTSAETKKPKLQSYAQVSKTTKMAVVKEGFPSHKLSSSEAMTLQREILKRVDSLPEGDHLPRFSLPTVVDGVLMLHCDDAWTMDWLQKLFHDNRNILKGVALKVMLASELPKPVKVAFKTRDVVTKEPKDLLRRLSKYNPKLKSGDWRILHRVVESQSIRWIFEVTTEAAREIKAAGYRAYTGLDRGFFKILREPSTRPEGDSTDPPKEPIKTVEEPKDVVPTSVPSVSAEPESMEVEKESFTSCEASNQQVSNVVSHGNVDELTLSELDIDTSSEGTLQPSSPFSSEEDRLLEDTSVETKDI